MAHKWHFRWQEGEASLPRPNGERFAVLFEHGSLTLEVYAPRGTDPQQPHDRDELYVVTKGSGTFVVGGDRIQFGPGDALFVPAHQAHRFEDFTENLAMWVVFYGPKGGESEAG